MPSKEGNKAVKVICLNCHITINALRDENGHTKSTCPRCGAMTVSKVITRRHLQYDIFAPQGQVLIN